MGCGMWISIGFPCLCFSTLSNPRQNNRNQTKSKLVSLPQQLTSIIQPPNLILDPWNLRPQIPHPTIGSRVSCTRLVLNPVPDNFLIGQKIYPAPHLILPTTFWSGTTPRHQSEPTPKPWSQAHSPSINSGFPFTGSLLLVTVFPFFWFAFSYHQYHSQKEENLIKKYSR